MSKGERSSVPSAERRMTDGWIPATYPPDDDRLVAVRDKDGQLGFDCFENGKWAGLPEDWEGTDAWCDLPPSAPSSGAVAQGLCETTQTPRFQIKDCACGTYEGNLGPCLTWWEGANVGKCVYCEHGLDCHVKLSKLLASEKPQADPKNVNLAALVLKLDKHISLHEMFAAEWEAIAAEARRTAPAEERTTGAERIAAELEDAMQRGYFGHKNSSGHWFIQKAVNELRSLRSASGTTDEESPMDSYTIPTHELVPPKKDWGRATVGLDGNCGYALLGEDLQSGEAEFVEIEGWPDHTYKQGRAAWGRALKKLEERLGSGPLRYEVT